MKVKELIELLSRYEDKDMLVVMRDHIDTPIHECSTIRGIHVDYDEELGEEVTVIESSSPYNE